MRITNVFHRTVNKRTFEKHLSIEIRMQNVFIFIRYFLRFPMFFFILQHLQK